jgi:hypothetical protein
VKIEVSMIARPIRSRRPVFHDVERVGSTLHALCGHYAPASTWSVSRGPATCQACIRARKLATPPPPVIPHVGKRVASRLRGVAFLEARS